MDSDIKAVMVKEQSNDKKFQKLRTTIGLKITTKNKLDENRAPGQCYDGFIYQLVDLWEKFKKARED